MGSYRQVYYHIVFGTKYRKPVLEPGFETELYQYIAHVVRLKKCFLYAINGTEDHIHLLTDLHPAVCLSSLVKDIKTASSIWLKEHPGFPGFTAWQEGYGAFTCSERERPMVVAYIHRQKEQHIEESFYDEYKRMLSENSIHFNEAYIL